VDLTEEERAERGIESLPEDLHAAIKAAQGSELMRRTLGDHVFSKLIQNKQLEWNRYRAQVTDFELNEYLPIL
jgi:glutamine synthetase